MWFFAGRGRKKQKKLFSHMAGSMGSRVQRVFRSHAILEFNCFCCLLLLSDLHHPPTLHAFLSSAVVLVVLVSGLSFLVSCLLAHFVMQY